MRDESPIKYLVARLSPDDVCHLVLILPHHHPKVPGVADGGDVEVELFLSEVFREEEEGGGEGSREVGVEGSLETGMTLQHLDWLV